MTTRFTPSVVMATLLIPASVLAQTAAIGPPVAERFVDPVSGLTLDQAIAQALEREPSLGAARRQIDAARGLQQQAALRPNPALTFEWRDATAAPDNLISVGVEWPLDLFRRSGRVTVGDREVLAAELAVADRERQLAAEVRTRFGEVLAVVRDLALVDELLEATRRQHELLRARAEEGTIPSLERDLVDVEVRRLESERFLQAGRAEAALLELKRVLGMRASEPLTVRDRLDVVVAQELSTTRDASDPSRAVEARADVREADARVAVADARIARAENDGRADVSLFGNYMRMDAGFPQRAFAADGSLAPVHGVFHYVSAGAMVTIPLRNRNQGEIAAARAEQAGATATRQAARLSAETELAAAQARNEHARQAVQVYLTGAQTLARRNLTVVGQSYELGRVTVFEVLAEQRRYLEVERGYTEALRAAFEARTALYLALGELR